MGPWVPRYVTTGCLVLFATGFALATPATASRVVRKKVIDTMMVRFGTELRVQKICLSWCYSMIVGRPLILYIEVSAYADMPILYHSLAWLCFRSAMASKHLSRIEHQVGRPIELQAES